MNELSKLVSTVKSLSKMLNTAFFIFKNDVEVWHASEQTARELYHDRTPICKIERGEIVSGRDAIDSLIAS